MIKSITVTNHLGDSLKMDLANPDTSGLIIESIDGLGPVKADINTVDVATFDGTIFNSARLPERNIVIKVYYMFKDTIEDTRQLSYKYFPIKKKINLVIETDNRKLTVDGYVEKNEPDIFSEKESSQISIICPNPYFYSAGEDGKTVTVFSGIVSEFEFPFENNSTTENLIEMGEILNKTSNYVYYNGDGEVGFSMVIHALGAVTNLKIYNLNTRGCIAIDNAKLVALTGSGIIASDTITINTATGSKGIELLRNGVTTNILNCIGKDSEWFTLTKGDNIWLFINTCG
jgi:hypothetical protein